MIGDPVAGNSLLTAAAHLSDSGRIQEVIMRAVLYVIKKTVDCLIMRRVAKMRISHTAAVWLGTPYSIIVETSWREINASA